MRPWAYIINTTVWLLLTLQAVGALAQSLEPTLARTPAFQLEHFEPLGDGNQAHFNLELCSVFVADSFKDLR